MYGLPGLKTHSKITLFEREVDGQTRREVHLGTGNYHDGTARLYTDFGLLTADPTLTSDAVAFFRGLESGGAEALEELVTAPDQLAPTLLDLIERECGHALAGRGARIVAKMNSLSDKAINQGAAQCWARGRGNRPDRARHLLRDPGNRGRERQHSRALHRGTQPGARQGFRV